MTAKQLTGASPNKRRIDWDNLDWNKIEAFVFRLQRRIAKAEREGKPGKVKALQRLFTTSFYTKCWSVYRVKTNKGAKTPGVDGKLWSTNNSKEKAVHSLRRKGYKPKPLRRIYIDKKSGGKRPLSIPTMKDRAMQALWHMALVPIAEERADPNAYGFRPKRSAQDAMERCFNLLCRRTSPKWILEIDIHKCFDQIDHQWLLDNIPMDKVILKKFLKAGFIEEGKTYPTDSGTPQGGIISPTLALMALSGLEKAVTLNRKQKKQPKKLIKVSLYADDGIITARSKEIIEQEILPKLTEFLKERGLSLSSTKTKITHIDEGFDFLGFNVKRYQSNTHPGGSVLFIKPSKRSIQTMKNQIKQCVKSCIALPRDKLIYLLNPKITGWANYFKGAVSSRVFADLDSFLTQKLLKWGYKRHARKGKRWIARHYFKTVGNDNWRFFANVKDKKGCKIQILLKQFQRTKIWRHNKIRSDANPFNPEFDDYFKLRDIKLKEARLSNQLGQYSSLICA